MTGPPGPEARLRVAVRRALEHLPVKPLPGKPLLLVACSGGPDSMALAAATAFVAPRAGFRAGLVTVDHGLQDGSADRAAAVAEWARRVGLDPVETATVTVDPARGGPEAAARGARYTALDQAARRHRASAILLGHTRDDQAETVLLALARGSGPRGLAAMPARRGLYLRPLLDLPRADTVRTCHDLELPVWDDPHNTDPAYARSRLRAAMPVLVETFGERFVANLARTATLVAADTEALDEQAADLLATAAELPADATEPRPPAAAPPDTSADVTEPRRPAAEPPADSTDPRLSAAGPRASASGTAEARLDPRPLATVHRAIRTRVLRGWVLSHGADADALSYVHIDALDTLVTRWRGQGPVFLPGKVTVRREADRLRLRREGG